MTMPHMTTCTKYPIGSNALWEVLCIFLIYLPMQSIRRIKTNTTRIYDFCWCIHFWSYVQRIKLLRVSMRLRSQSLIGNNLFHMCWLRVWQITTNQSGCNMYQCLLEEICFATVKLDTYLVLELKLIKSFKLIFYIQVLISKAMKTR